MGNPCVVSFAENWAVLAGSCEVEMVGLTLQDVGLQGGGLASTLQRPAVDEVKDHAVGELLLVLVGRVGSLELGEVEAFSKTLWI